jgi:hypothetical protein
MFTNERSLTLNNLLQWRFPFVKSLKEIPIIPSKLIANENHQKYFENA